MDSLKGGMGEAQPDRMPMTINFRGRIQNMRLPRSKPLMPLFEAVVNSIQATAANDQPGAIRVHILRDRSSQPGLPGAAHEPAVTGFRIDDNGVGFTDENFQSFRESDSRHKLKIGGKGVGRLMWLKCFTDVIVDSVYQGQDGTLRRRQFKFMLHDEPIVGHRDEPASGIARKTSVHLRSLNTMLAGIPNYPKGAKTIAQHLIDHCLLHLLSAKAPRIVVEDDDGTLYDLNSLLLGGDADLVTREQITCGDECFDVRHVQLSSAVEARKHRIVFFGDGRAVSDTPLKDHIPDLRAPLRVGDREFWWTALVSGNYLDTKVDPERDGFSIPQTPADGLFHSGPSMSELCDAVVQSVKPRVDPLLEGVRALRDGVVRRYIEHEAPHYRIVYKYAPDALVAIDPTASNENIDEALYKIYASVDRQARREARELLRESGTAQELDKRLEAVLTKVTDVGRSDRPRA